VSPLRSPTTADSFNQSADSDTDLSTTNFYSLNKNKLGIRKQEMLGQVRGSPIQGSCNRHFGKRFTRFESKI